MASIQKITLAPLELRAVTTTTEAVAIDNGAVDLVGVLVCTAVNGGAPTIDAKIQTSIDNGSNWFDICAFTQLTTTGTEMKLLTLPALAQVRAIITLGGTITDATCKVELAYRDARR